MPRHSYCRISRRRFLEAGTVALFSGATELCAGTLPRPVGGAKRCILVYLLGGPSHIDMWDLKPNAPSEIRGPFQPIQTPVPGMMISEHLPQLAQQAGRLALVRSVAYPNNDHPFMTYYTLTGRVSPVPLGANTVLPPSRRDDPHMGAVVSKFRHGNRNVPGYVAIPEVRVRMKPMPIAGGGQAGFLGPRFDPFNVNEDPRAPIDRLNLTEGVSSERFENRQRILAMLEGDRVGPKKVEEYRAHRGSAARFVRSAETNGLFSLSQEPNKIRERYGQGRFGQSLLLARRLVERNVSFVGVHFNYMSKCDGWDTHSKNFECLKGELLPVLDRGLSALLEDLAQRGLLDDTLVVTMGEFGRTPRINSNGGRDHWGACASVLFAGGGVRGGNLIGATDKHAAYPVDAPFGPPDVVASIYHALGMQPNSLMYDAYLGRPMTLSEGRPIAGLF